MWSNFIGGGPPRSPVLSSFLIYSDIVGKAFLFSNKLSRHHAQLYCPSCRNLKGKSPRSVNSFNWETNAIEALLYQKLRLSVLEYCVGVANKQLNTAVNSKTLTPQPEKRNYQTVQRPIQVIECSTIRPTPNEKN